MNETENSGDAKEIKKRRFRVRLAVEIYHTDVLLAENQAQAEEMADKLFDKLSFDDYNGINIMPNIQVRPMADVEV